MAYEAACGALAGGTRRRRTVISVTQAAPFGLKKLSGTLARALGVPDARPLDIGGGPGGAAGRARDRRGPVGEGDGQPALVVASDHLVSYEERVCDILSAGGAAAFLVGASGGFARLGPVARAGREVYDVWRLGTEPEARYRLEVLFDSYAAIDPRGPRRPRRGHRAGHLRLRRRGASQPHPQTLRGLGKAGVVGRAARATSFVGRDRQPGRRVGGRGPGARPRPGRARASTSSRSATAAGRRSRRTSR